MRATIDGVEYECTKVEEWSLSDDLDSFCNKHDKFQDMVNLCFSGSIEQFEKAKKEYQELIAPVQEKKPLKRWRAEKEYTYWFIDGSGVHMSGDFAFFDTGNYLIGNYYKTEQLAQAALDKQKAIVRVNDAIDELNSEKENGDFIYTISSQEGFHPASLSKEHKYPLFIKEIIGEESAEQIIKQHQEDLKIIFDIK